MSAMPKSDNISQLPEPTDVGELIALYQPRLHAYILSLVFDPQVAADILQDTNLILWKKAAQFTPGTNFKAWAFRVAYFEVKSHRRKAVRNRLVFNDELLDSAELAARAERDNQVRTSEGLEHRDLDPRLVAAMDHPLPACSGVALGVDRLLMRRLNATAIADVMPFGWERA